MARMSRRIIQPWQFGTLTPYAFTDEDAEPASANGLIAHMDYITTYKNLSYRLWEPGREAFSTPGSYGDDGSGKGPELPATVTLHGVKGHIDIAFGTQDKDLGQFYTDAGVPIVVDAAGNGANPNTMDYADAWMSLTGQHGPGNFLDQQSIGQAIGEANWETGHHQLIAQAPLLRIPLFVCMYRGTYKQIDDNTGWEIDSGPPDDPDTLLGVDITNPTVLESSRIDWWDMEMYPFPKPHVQYNLVAAGDGPAQEPVWSNSGGGFHRYPVNLDANKTLGPDQVLWLQLQTGVIRLLGCYFDDTGTRVWDSVLYEGHQFSAAIHASALVTRKLAI